MIETGTLCFIVKARPGNERLLGRVVTVIGVPGPRPETDMRLAYAVDAPWLRAEHPRCRCFAEPTSLLPIAGPPKPPLVTRKREPEHA